VNLTTYERRDVASWYGSLDSLFPAERVIAELVLTPDTDMVDLGVGGGRTTKQLAARCGSYIGLDYATAMVEEARRTCAPGTHIIRADATRMHQIADASADFVLFSFNGIDYVPHAERMKILHEVRRICRPGARFAFSSHNLLAAPKAFLPARPSPKAVAKAIAQQALNFPLGLKAQRPHALLNDGAHRFGLLTYYVRPTEQFQQLAEAGFNSIKMFAFYTGQAVGADTTDGFPYYLCVAG
jgi:ubiquinone/menaquinone biosynthesis C-methylase UbiE